MKHALGRLWLWILLSHGQGLATDYFVSPRGDDGRSGRTARNAWRSIERVNRHLASAELRPGDRIQFQGGRRFDGGLVLDSRPVGTREAPVVITSYSIGRATLHTTTNHGILVRETPWVCISNLILQAAPGNRADGIRFDRSVNTGSRIPGVHIEGCTLRGFGFQGIMIDAAQRDHGFEGVRIQDCEAEANRYTGIKIYGGNPSGRSHYPHAWVEILGCSATDNPGDPAQVGYHSGSGIAIDGTEHARVRGCVAARNGMECRSERGGPVGIWAHASRDVIIEGCEAYLNRSSFRDGGGFDLDGGCSDSVLQGNFAHNNDGPGFMIYSYTGAPYADSGCQVIRNVSWHNGRRGSGYADLQISAEYGQRIVGLMVTDNTVVSPDGALSPLRINGNAVEARFERNLLVAAPHGSLTSISGLGHRLVFRANQFWRPDRTPVHLIDTQWPVPRLETWSAGNPEDSRIQSFDELFEEPQIPRTLRLPNSSRRPRWPKLTTPTRPVMNLHFPTSPGMRPAGRAVSR